MSDLVDKTLPLVLPSAANMDPESNQPGTALEPSGANQPLVPGGDTSLSDIPADIFEAFGQSDVEPGDDAQPGDDDDSPGEEKKPAKRGRKSASFRALESKLDDAQREAAQMRQGWERAYQDNQRLAQQLDAANRERSAVMARLDRLEQGVQPASSSGDPEVDKFKTTLMAELEAKLANRVGPAIRSLSEENERLRQRLDQDAVERRQAAERERILAHANAAVREYVANGFTEEELNQPLRGGTLVQWLETFVTAASYGKQVDIGDAARVVRQVTDALAVARYRSHARTKGSKIAESRKTRSAAPGSRATKTGMKVWTNEEAEKAGYKDALDAAMSEGPPPGLPQ